MYSTQRAVLPPGLTDAVRLCGLSVALVRIRLPCGHGCTAGQECATGALQAARVAHRGDTRGLDRAPVTCRFRDVGAKGRVQDLGFD